MSNLNDIESPDKIHYEKLISFFKWLIGVVGAMTALAIFLIGESIGEIKNDMRSELDSLQEELDELRNESKSLLTDVKYDSKEYLIESRESAKIQLSAIKEESKYLILESIKNEVIQNLNKNNIELLVKQIADDELRAEVEYIIKNQLKDITAIIDIMPTLTIYYEQMRWGNREYLDKLDSISRFNDNENIRNIAKQFMLQKGRDYDSSWGEDGDINYVQIKSQLFKNKNIEETKLSNLSYRDSLINKVSNDILFNKDLRLDNITENFILLRILLNEDTINNFDMDRIRIILVPK